MKTIVLQYKIQFFLFFPLIITQNIYCQTYVSTQEEAQSAIDKGVSDIVLENGIYNDFSISFPESSSNITFRAETPGEVIITGESNFEVRGDSNNVEDYVFFNIKKHDVNVDKFDIVSFYYAENCELNNCAFIDCGKPDLDPSGSYDGGRIVVFRYGNKNNKVSNCYWRGSFGSCLVLTHEASFESDGITNEKNIFNNNYLYNITEWDSINGNDPFIIGYYKNSYGNFTAVGSDNKVQFNLFENTISDKEIISVKISDTKIYCNTFLNSSTTKSNPQIQIRTGNNSTISGNFFIGTDAGITVFGKNHKIFNNYFNSYVHGIYLPGGQVIPDPNNADYISADDCEIFNNTIVNAPLSFRFGKPEYTIPNNNSFTNNVVYVDTNSLPSGSDTPNLFWDKRHMQPDNTYTYSAYNIEFKNNIAFTNHSNGGGVDTFKSRYNMEGDTEIKVLNPQLEIIDNLYKLGLNSAGLINTGETINYDFFTNDMDGQERDQNIDIGADEYSTSPILNKPLTPNDVGPDWLTNYEVFRDTVYNWKKWVLYDTVAGKDSAFLKTILPTTTPILQLNFGGDDGFEYTFDSTNKKYIITCNDSKPRRVKVTAQDFNENNIVNISGAFEATIENWVVKTISCFSKLSVTGNGECVQLSNNKGLPMNLYNGNHSYLETINNGGTSQNSLILNDTYYIKYNSKFSVIPNIAGICSIEYTVKPSVCGKSKSKVMINENNSSVFSIYPNPTNDIFTIVSDKKITSILVYNNLGKLLKSISKKNSIDISKLTSNIYFIMIMGDNGVIGVDKIIKD